MSHQQAKTPVRGFEWRLAPLQRKLEWELDAARTKMAACVTECEHATQRVADAEQLLGQASSEARQAMSASADPRAHRGLLQYLVWLGEQRAVAGENEKSAAKELNLAREDLVARQQRLDVLLHARSNALDLHLLEATRREQAEADAGWLGLRELGRSQRDPEARP